MKADIYEKAKVDEKALKLKEMIAEDRDRLSDQVLDLARGEDPHIALDALTDVLSHVVWDRLPDRQSFFIVTVFHMLSHKFDAVLSEPDA